MSCVSPDEAACLGHLPLGVTVGAALGVLELKGVIEGTISLMQPLIVSLPTAELAAKIASTGGNWRLHKLASRVQVVPLSRRLAGDLIELALALWRCRRDTRAELDPRGRRDTPVELTYAWYCTSA